MKVSSWLNLWSKSSWRSSNTFVRNIILNKQLIPNERSKQHQTKRLPHKAKKIMSYNSTQHHNHPEKAEWLAQKKRENKQKIRKKQEINTLKTSEGTKSHLKKADLKPKPEALSEVCACLQKKRPALKNKHQTTTFRQSQEFPPKESEVTPETRIRTPSTLRRKQIKNTETPIKLLRALSTVWMMIANNSDLKSSIW